MILELQAPNGRAQELETWRVMGYDRAGGEIPNKWSEFRLRPISRVQTAYRSLILDKKYPYILPRKGDIGIPLSPFIIPDTGITTTRTTNAPCDQLLRYAD